MGVDILEQVVFGCGKGERYNYESIIIIIIIIVHLALYSDFRRVCVTANNS